MRTPVRAVLATAIFTTTMLTMIGIAFYAGYVSARVGAPLPIVGALPLPPGLPSARPRASTEDARDRLGILLEAWRIVDAEYYDPAALDNPRMSYGAIKGLLETLGDAHTTLADPQRARQQSDEIRGVFDGIGISIEVRDGRVLVARVIEDSPAQAAGLMVGDAIARVDDEAVREPVLDGVVGKIRGPRGTRVRLELVRGPPGTPPFAVDVTRGEIRTAPVRSRMLEGNVAYVRLPSFSGTANKDLAEELRRIVDARPVGLVVDLRNNPGGLLHSAVDVASQFLDAGIILYEQRRDREPTPFHVRGRGVATELPMVVLVNRGSASAAEIVAGALQDRQRALLVGERTFGKDSVQNVHQLSDRSSLRVTSAKWFTPLRQPIAGKGLTPDVVVSSSDEDRRAGRDPQLDRAADLLRTRLARAD